MANGLQTIAAEVMRETGYNPPSTFIGNNGQDARRMVAVVNRAGRDLAKRPWQRLIRDFTISASTTALYALPTDWYQFISNTGWNSSGTDPLIGPITNQEWAYFTNAVATTGIYYRFRIFAEVISSGVVQRLQVDPVPGSTTQTFVINYHTHHWAIEASATTTAAWNVEAQDPIVDSELLSLAVKWRWMKAKGLNYSDDFEEYRKALDRELAREGGQGPKLRMDSAYTMDYPNVPDTGIGL